MKKLSSFCLLSFFFLCFITSPGFGQKTADILEKMIEAQGGRKLLEKIKDSTFSGTMEMIQMGIEGSMTIYHKEPNKLRQEIEFMGMIITTVFDGETAWMTNPETGNVEELPEKAVEQTKREAIDFGNAALLHPEKYGITYTFKGKENIEGKDYFVLDRTFPDGHKATIYVDSENYLIYKTVSTADNPMTGMEVEAEILLSDYKKIDGMIIPHSIKIFYEGEEFGEMAVTEVKFNSGLEDSFFKM